jgi:hypothetical protein
MVDNLLPERFADRSGVRFYRYLAKQLGDRIIQREEK